jgi:hypothetical protein
MNKRKWQHPSLCLLPENNTKSNIDVTIAFIGLPLNGPKKRTKSGDSKPFDVISQNIQRKTNIPYWILPIEVDAFIRFSYKH